MKRALLLIAALAVFSPQRVLAAQIFFDDFNSEHGGVGQLNYNAFANFTVSDGTVDLIGNGFFDFLPGNGLYVDLDGSTGNAGIQTSNGLPLGAGDYSLDFYMAGSHRGDVNEVLVNVFGPLNPSYGALIVINPPNNPFSFVSIAFTLSAPDTIRFSFSNDGGDNIGALLDNVAINSAPTAVPEPASLLLVGSGILGLVRRRTRRKKGSDPLLN
jgi:hypothetical protein